MNGIWKYIDPKTWELVTRIDGVEVSRSGDLNKVLRHFNRKNK